MCKTSFNLVEKGREVSGKFARNYALSSWQVLDSGKTGRVSTHFYTSFTTSFNKVSISDFNSGGMGLGSPGFTQLFTYITTITN